MSRNRLGGDPHIYRSAVKRSLVESPRYILITLRRSMNSDLSEEEMRLALFGQPQPEVQISVPQVQDPVPEVMFNKPTAAPVTKKKVAKPFTLRLRVTLQVGNEFEGKTYELIHDADTLSTLLAEQEAVKAARKKYKYVEVVSVKSM